MFSLLKLPSLHRIYINSYNFVEFSIDLVLFYVFWYSPSVFGWYLFGISFQKCLKLISHMYIFYITSWLNRVELNHELSHSLNHWKWDESWLSWITRSMSRDWIAWKIRLFDWVMIESVISSSESWLNWLNFFESLTSLKISHRASIGWY